MLQEFVNWFLYSVLKLNSGSEDVQMLNFFIYDSIKILALLFVIIFILGIVRTYLSREKVRKLLSKEKYGSGNLIASCFGAVTPFCSCSSIPLFLSFIESGVPLGVGFSFLITSPLVNEYLVVLMLGFFGVKITLLYVLSGILIGVIAGLILGKMNLEKYLSESFKSTKKTSEKVYRTFRERAEFGFNEAKKIIKSLWIWILFGVFVGAIIHNKVPESAIQALVSQGGIFAVPLAVLLGIPMYGSAAAIVPIAVALFEKGVPLGTLLSFIMAIAALSLPEAIILKRIMKVKLIAIFFGIVAFGIIITGYLFNFLS